MRYSIKTLLHRNQASILRQYNISSTLIEITHEEGPEKVELIEITREEGAEKVELIEITREEGAEKVELIEITREEGAEKVELIENTRQEGTDKDEIESFNLYNSFRTGRLRAYGSLILPSNRLQWNDKMIES
ncbi:MAG TPA: hypothetical protein VL921_20115 [Candidatus Udaeobacter sp.]|nr:hypothetical protein [Candidatus Udaeobacter sp.]